MFQRLHLLEVRTTSIRQSVCPARPRIGHLPEPVHSSIPRRRSRSSRRSRLSHHGRGRAEDQTCVREDWVSFIDWLIDYKYSRTVLQREAMEAEIGQSPANFGSTSQRHCICEVGSYWVTVLLYIWYTVLFQVQGQQPCPATVETPMYLKGSWRHMRNTD